MTSNNLSDIKKVIWSHIGSFEDIKTLMYIIIYVRCCIFMKICFPEKNKINHLTEFEIQGIGTSLQDESGEVGTET